MKMADFFTEEQMELLEKFCPVKDSDDSEGSEGLLLMPNDACLAIKTDDEHSLVKYAKAIADKFSIEVLLKLGCSFKPIHPSKKKPESNKTFFALLREDLKAEKMFKESLYKREISKLGNAIIFATSHMSIREREDLYSKDHE